MEAPEENEVAHKKNLPKKNRKNAKRFSDEQIKSLESSFKLESKLEPSKKLQIARDLGLQPRQVAIWFQNRRARWKSKQIEQDYKVLKANYEDLYAQSEFLMREKQSLQMQLQELKNLLKNPLNENAESKEILGCLDSEGVDPNGVIHAGDEEKISNYFGPEEEGDSSPLASPETWCNLCSDALFDESCDNPNWWEN
ncbi:homeobox-leucine zipper protein ATHB-12-like [Olea europaea var. sylvestris]|uniref:homeobox-leucine zipper protein ATHB-12-like n=1 Tax=Olea europaea var. sylvestris TaxID=158386 RepID=UPI000C1D7985|nr:homeobox-leucine zipper protein ATHB-12-like [Olea europaea var. sylvestris]